LELRGGYSLTEIENLTSA